VPWLFHWPILHNAALNKTFDVALHAGTFVGAVAYFRGDIVLFLRAWFRSIRRRSIEHTDERIAWFLVIGTIPGAIVGALFESTIEDKLGQPWLIAVMLALFGALLWAVDRRARQVRRMRDLGLRDALIIGLAQAVALQPGVSRSGVTITASRALGMTREAAARFSFLLSLPIIGGAALYEGQKIVRGKLTIPPGFGPAFAWGMIASAVSGFLVIWFLLAFLRRRSFTPFVIYRFAVALFVLGIIVAGVRPGTV
jgi:undecaprenyl-diphosphatase